MTAYKNGSYPRRKGATAEVLVRNWLRGNGFPYCERLPQDGYYDRGDLTGIDPSVMVEVKAQNKMELGGWMEEVEVQMRNANAEIGVCVHKRRGRLDPADWFVSMPGSVFLRLLRHWTGTTGDMRRKKMEPWYYTDEAYDRVMTDEDFENLVEQFDSGRYEPVE